MCMVVFGDRINIDRCEVWFWVRKKRFVDQMRDPD